MDMPWSAGVVRAPIVAHSQLGESDGPDTFSPFCSNDIELLCSNEKILKSDGIDCCAYICSTGHCRFVNWRKHERFRTFSPRLPEGIGNSDKLGLLLDLTRGRLTVYKNGRRLGLLMEGLSGRYCWMCQLASKGSGVIINRGVVPNGVRHEESAPMVHI